MATRSLGLSLASLLCFASLLAPGRAMGEPSLPNEVTTSVANSVGDGNNTVDIWKVKCGAPTSKMLCVGAHADTHNDTTDKLVVTVVGVAPAAIIGRGDIDSGIGAAPHWPFDVCVSRPTPGPITAVGTVSATSLTTTFQFYAYCVDKNLIQVANPVITKVTNQ